MWFRVQRPQYDPAQYEVASVAGQARVRPNIPHAITKHIPFDDWLRAATDRARRARRRTGQRAANDKGSRLRLGLTFATWSQLKQRQRHEERTELRMRQEQIEQQALLRSAARETEWNAWQSKANGEVRRRKEVSLIENDLAQRISDEFRASRSALSVKAFRKWRSLSRNSVVLAQRRRRDMESYRRERHDAWYRDHRCLSADDKAARLQQWHDDALLRTVRRDRVVLCKEIRARQARIDRQARADERYDQWVNSHRNAPQAGPGQVSRRPADHRATWRKRDVVLSYSTQPLASPPLPSS